MEQSPTQQDPLQQRLQKVVAAGRHLLNAQNEYFRIRKLGYNATADLEKCKRLEREFDRLLAEEQKLLSNKQQNLF